MNDLLIGRRFICPKWTLDFPHIGVVIKQEEISMRRWLQVQRWLLCYSTGYSLGGISNRWLNPSKDSALVALIAWLLLLLLSLFCFAPSPFGVSRFFAALLAAYSIGDSLLVNTSIVFASQQPRLPLRSAILGGFAFFELSLAFAVFYLLLPEKAMHPELKDGLTALYFSLVTIVTLGYGDIRPSHCSQQAQVLVMAEIIIGLYFLYTLFATIVNWANSLGTLPTLRELQKKSTELDQEYYY